VSDVKTHQKITGRLGALQQMFTVFITDNHFHLQSKVVMTLPSDRTDDSVVIICTSCHNMLLKLL